jgi:hypothetical protein
MKIVYEVGDGDIIGAGRFDCFYVEVRSGMCNTTGDGLAVIVTRATRHMHAPTVSHQEECGCDDELRSCNRNGVTQYRATSKLAACCSKLKSTSRDTQVDGWAEKASAMP